VVYGGVDMTPQLKALHAGVEILVATPGRLLDHAQQKSVNLSRVEILVLDEADRMLDMGFLPDIKRILALLPAQRQNLLFSATFSEEIKRLANQLLHSPLLIEVARRNAPADLVKHQVFEVPALRKRALLAHLIRSRDMKQVLVFVRMKRDANRLARELVRDGIMATAIHSDRTQAERELALQEFKDGKATVLVATDIAARGIDIEELPYVVNYELPYTPEDYVHRIGRTGRAGLPGEAISLMCPDEARLLGEIEKLLKRELPREPAVDYGRPPRQDDERPQRRADPARGYGRERHAPRSSAPQKTVDASGFDFSKPYEPTATDAASAPAPAPRLRGSVNRPVAALLGGFAPPDKDKK
jgi:ATP-dependent RNA helicase RhlE